MYYLLCLFFQLYLIFCVIPTQAIAGGKTARLERREYQDPVVLWDHQDVPVATERMDNEESQCYPGDGSNAPGHLTNQKIVGTMDKCT